MSSNDENEGVEGISGYFVPVAVEQKGRSASLIDLYELLVAKRIMLVAGSLLGAISLLAASFLFTPQYRVEVVLSPVEYSTTGSALSQVGGALGSLGALAGIGVGDSGSRGESLAVLGSKYLTTSFVEQQGLMSKLFQGDWDENSKDWAVTDPADIPTSEDAYRVFDEDIRRIVVDRDSGLVSLSITWSDPDEAAEWANLLVKEANDLIRERAVAEFRKSIEYLNSELEHATVVGVKQAIYSVIQGQIEQVMLATVREDYAFKILDPAVPPDRDDEVFPSKILFVAIGLIVGFSIAAMFALLITNRNRSTRA